MEIDTRRSPERISGQDAAKHVAKLKPFTNHSKSLFGLFHHNPVAPPPNGDGPNEPLYIVYSYGAHWPLYIYDSCSKMWFGNRSKTTPTTSKHASHAYPQGVRREDMHWLDCDQMIKLARVGSYVTYCAERIDRHLEPPDTRKDGI